VKQVRRRQQSLAFTIIEILVVIVIVAILSAFLYPVFARAKRQAKIADGWNRMKQTTVALTLYSQDNEDKLPNISVAKTVVPRVVQCHPFDDWRPECLARNESLMLGSWGYTPSDPEPSPIEPPRSTWIVNVFSVEQPTRPVFSYRTDANAACIADETCFVQERIECMGSDASLRVVKRKLRKKFEPGPYMVFDWNTAFDLCRGATHLEKG
jgi:prepilin-type N-terminal cleavage/methylation domain-containing protein